MFVAFLLCTSYNWKKYLQKHWKTHFTDRRDMGDTEVWLFYKQFFQILLNVIFVPPPYYIVRWFVKMIERFRTRFFSSNRSPHLTRTFEQKYLSQNENNDLVELKLKKKSKGASENRLCLCENWRLKMRTMIRRKRVQLKKTNGLQQSLPSVIGSIRR